MSSLTRSESAQNIKVDKAFSKYTDGVGLKCYVQFSEGKSIFRVMYIPWQ